MRERPLVFFIILILGAATFAPAAVLAQDDAAPAADPAAGSGSDEEPDERGTLVIAFKSIPAEDSMHEYVETYSSGGFTSGTFNANGGRIVSDIPADDLTFEVQPHEDWAVIDIACDDGDSVAPSMYPAADEIASQGASIHAFVEPDETVSCTVTLAQGEVQIELKTLPRYLDEDFGFDVEGSDYRQILAEAPETYKKPPGGYEATLNLFDERWETERANCVETNPEAISVASTEPPGAALGVDAGDVIKCDFVIRDRRVPREGKWQVSEAQSWLRCPQEEVELKKFPPHQAWLNWRNRGHKLVGRARGSTLRLTRAEGTDTYGEYRGRGQQGSKIFWRIDSPVRIAGRNVLPGARVGRPDCRLERVYTMRWNGDS